MGLGADTLPSETIRRCLQHTPQDGGESVKRAARGPGDLAARQILIGLTWLELPTSCNQACPHPLRSAMR